MRARSSWRVTVPPPTRAHAPATDRYEAPTPLGKPDLGQFARQVVAGRLAETYRRHGLADWAAWMEGRLALMQSA